MNHPLTATTLLFLATSVFAQPAPGLYDLDTVREIRLYFKQANYWTLLQQNYSSKTNIEADLKVDGVTYPRVGVRFRGNTSYRSLPAGSEKAGFNIETDAFVVGQSLMGYEHLNLNNGFHDPTFMREVITYQVARRYMCAPQANFVKVFLNDQPWGIYINVQQPNKDMMREWFRDKDGNRYRGFPNGGSFNDSALNYLGNVAANYMRGYEFKQGDGTDLMQMITVLNQSTNLAVDLPKVLSVDQGYWYCIVMNALAHTDSYIGTGKDHFHYHDPVHGTFHIFPFDVNESFGAEGTSSTLSPFYNHTNALRPLLSKTLPVADWTARHDAHYRTVLREVVNWNYIGGLVAKYQAMIAADVAADTKKIYPTSAFTSNVTTDYTSGRTVIRGLKPLIEGRETYLKTIPRLTATEATLSDLAHAPLSPKNTETVTVTVRAAGAASVSLYYRGVGAFIEASMFDDGSHGDGAANDGVFGAFVPPMPGGTQVDYYAGAKTSAGVLCFLPRYAEFQSPHYVVQHPVGASPIVINEILASNSTVNKDPFGEYDDWVELRNTSNAPVSISGMYITDDTLKPTKFMFGTGISIPANGTLLVWCDENGSQGPLHANFKVSAVGGETIMLFDTDGKTMLDSMFVGPQKTDVSTGRLFDTQSSPLVTFPKPSPDAPNYTGTGGVRSYSSLDSTLNTMLLGLTGVPKSTTQASLDLAGGPSSSAFLLSVSLTAAHLPFLNGVTLLTSGGGAEVILPTDVSGSATIPFVVPSPPGVPIYCQALAVGTGGFLASNGLELILYN
ncbi:MAG: CotH kinase family protein [Planctomycetes bacterium]|nr:CotH kinase family protein [Planctomycetota bacterium]